MSITAEDTAVAPNLGDLDVPMTEAAPKPEANFNDAPPPLPELFDENGRQVPYIADLMLGKDSIKKETYDEKDSDGKKTGNKAAYFTADLLAKVVAAGDGREIELRDFDTFVRPQGRFTSFVPRGKQLSEIAHLAKIAGLDITGYQTVGQLAPDLVRELSKRGEQAVQAKIFGQWQWYDKNFKWTTKAGAEKEGKTVRYGMKNADTQNPDGSYDARIIHKETGNELVARFVITRIEPL